MSQIREIRKPKKPLTGWRLGEDMQNGFAGLPLGYTDEKVYLANETKHGIIVGTTGSGKTQKLIFPMVYACGHSGESMVITDPKGEIYNETSGFLANKGYNVRVINLRNPFESDGWNVLDQASGYFQKYETLAREYDRTLDSMKLAESVKAQGEAIECIREIAYAITHQNKPSGDGETWANFASSLLSAVLIMVCRDKYISKKDNDKNNDLRNMFSATTILGSYTSADLEKSDLHEYITSYPAGDDLRSAYATIENANDKAIGSVLLTVNEALKIFSDQGVAQITKKSTFQLKEIGSKPTAVYVIFPDEKESRGILLSLFVDSVYKALVELANESEGGTCPVRVNMILDEFGQFPQIPNFNKKLAVARSRGVRFTIALQGFNQLNDVYGADVAGIIRENCNVLVYLLTGDFETAERISKLLGKQTIKNSSVSINEGKASLSTGLVQRDLMMPDELLKNDENTIISILSGKSFKAPAKWYYQMKNKELKYYPPKPLPALEDISIDPTTKQTPFLNFELLKEHRHKLNGYTDQDDTVEGLLVELANIAMKELPALEKLKDVSEKEKYINENKAELKANKDLQVIFEKYQQELISIIISGVYLVDERFLDVFIDEYEEELLQATAEVTAGGELVLESNVELTKQLRNKKIQAYKMKLLPVRSQFKTLPQGYQACKLDNDGKYVISNQKALWLALAEWIYYTDPEQFKINATQKQLFYRISKSANRIAYHDFIVLMEEILNISSKKQEIQKCCVRGLDKQYPYDLVTAGT